MIPARLPLNANRSLAGFLVRGKGHRPLVQVTVFEIEVSFRSMQRACFFQIYIVPFFHKTGFENGTALAARTERISENDLFVLVTHE